MNSMNTPSWGQLDRLCVFPPVGGCRLMQKLVTSLLVLGVLAGSGRVPAQVSLYEQAQENADDLKELAAENNALREDMNELAAEIEAQARTASVLLKRECGVDAGSALESLPRLEVLPIPALTLSADEEAAILSLMGEAPGSIPPFTKADYFMVALAGSLASAYDVFVVATPATSVATKKVKAYTLKLHEDFLSKLETTFKVPFDSEPMGRGHRGKSLGHDPLLGLIFGVYDIMNGRSTYVDKGQIISVPVKGFENKKLTEALISWMGHMLSDVGSKHGLPLPGWNMLQLAEVGKSGDKNRTLAEVARQMYNKGYDLRHYAVGAGSPAIIEVLIRTYHYLGLALQETPQFRDPADEAIWNEQNDAKLSAMLFNAHAMATGVNAGKVAIKGWRPPYIQGLLSINIAQWQMFSVSTLGYVRTVNRDVSVEHIRRNQNLLTDNWASMPIFEIEVAYPMEPTQ